ncbi:MAG: hypothetical protein QW203_07080 [Thermoplasmatales archaeon]
MDFNQETAKDIAKKIIDDIRDHPESWLTLKGYDITNVTDQSMQNKIVAILWNEARKNSEMMNRIGYERIMQPTREQYWMFGRSILEELKNRGYLHLASPNPLANAPQEEMPPLQEEEPGTNTNAYVESLKNELKAKETELRKVRDELENERTKNAQKKKYDTMNPQDREVAQVIDRENRDYLRTASAYEVDRVLRISRTLYSYWKEYRTQIIQFLANLKVEIKRQGNETIEEATDREVLNRIKGAIESFFLMDDKTKGYERIISEAARKQVEAEEIAEDLYIHWNRLAFIALDVARDVKSKSKVLAEILETISDRRMEEAMIRIERRIKEKEEKSNE